MRGRFVCAAALLLSASSVGAEDAGRTLNWQTQGAPNYQSTVLPSKDDYQLPPMALAVPESRDQQQLSEAPSVFVKDIKVTGSTVFSTAELTDMTQPYVGRDITTEDLQALRYALSNAYLQRGYINSGVVIPDQSVTDGVIELKAIEGTLTSIQIDGHPHLSDGYITSRVRRYVDTPLNLAGLQKALQMLQTDSHIARLDGRLLPGDELGQSVLHLSVYEPKRFEVGVSADNHRPASVGSEVGRVSMTARNLTGVGDATTVTYGYSDGANDGAATFTVPVTHWNTRVDAYYLHEHDEVIQQRFKDLDIKSETDTYGLNVSQPVIESLDNTLTLSTGMEVKRSQTELLGIPFSFSPGAQNGQANETIAQFGVDWSNKGANHVLALRATYRRGLDMWDATVFDPKTAYEELLNPTGADGEFDLGVFQGLFLYRMNQFPGLSKLNDRAQVVLRSTAQLSRDPLMSIEKVAIGGANTVRGYPANFLVRDNGVAATFELQLPIWGYRADASWRNLVVTPFFDYGRSWDEVDTDQASPTINTNDSRYITSLGVGLIWEPLQDLMAQMSWGYKLNDNFNGDDPSNGSSYNYLQDNGVYFSISYAKAF